MSSSRGTERTGPGNASPGPPEAESRPGIEEGVGGVPGDPGAPAEGHDVRPIGMPRDGEGRVSLPQSGQCDSVDECLRGFIEAAPAAMFEIAFDGTRFLHVSEVVCQLSGYAREELLAMSPFDLLDETGRERLRDRVARRLGGERVDEPIEVTVRRKDGAEQSLLVNAGALTYRGRSPSSVLVVAHDITARKRTEQALGESEARFRLLLANAPVSVAAQDRDLRFLWAYNQRSVRPEEIVGKTDTEIFPPEVAAYLTTLKRHVLATDTELRERAWVSSGGRRWFLDLFLEPLHDERGGISGVGVATVDLTDMRLAEEAAARHAAELEAVLAAQNDAVLTYDTDLRVTRGNASFLARYGFDPVGLHVSEIIARVRCRTLDGRPLMLEEQPTPRANGGEPVVGQCFLVRRGDGQETVVEVSSGPMWVGDCVAGSVTVWHDITERTRVESALRASLAEKEALLKEIHHRVKNNLQVIASLLSLQAEATDEAARKPLLESRGRVRAMALVHEKLYHTPDLSTIPFDECVADLGATLMAGMRRDGVSLDLDLEPVELGIANAIPLALVTNELLSNAVKHAFPDGREGRIVVGLHSTGTGEYELSVADNGVGFPEALDLRDPESLGLQIVSILTRQIGAQARLGREAGTRVTVTFRDVTP